MFTNGSQLIRHAVHNNAVQSLAGYDAGKREQVRQTDNVIKMGVRQKDVQPIGNYVVAKAIEACASVEDHPNFGNGKASRVALITGMVSGGAEQK
jgi:hypothetical protein